MILDYRDDAKVRAMIGQRVLITKFSTSLADDGHEYGSPLNLVATIVNGSYISVKFDDVALVPGYGIYTYFSFAWIEYIPDPDSNY